MIGSGIFHYIYHIGCACNLHSVINNGLIPRGQDLSRRQTVFFLPNDPRDKGQEDPEHFDFSVSRRARYEHSAWKRHQDAKFWVDINLAIREGLTFYQTRSNAIILHGTLPAYCIPKVERLKTGEVLYERRYLSPPLPPKISLKHDHNWTKGNDQSGSTVEQQPVGKLVQQSFGEAPRVKLSNPDPIQSVIDRGNLRTQNVFLWIKEKRTVHKRSMINVCTKNLALQIDRGNLRDCLKTFAFMHAHDGTGELVNRAQAHTQWKNLFLPNIVTLHHLTRTSSTLQPTRRTLTPTSQEAIMAAGNTELCEIINVEPEAQCRTCLTYWSTCGHFLRDGDIVTETATVSFHTLPVSFPLPTITRLLCSRCFVP